MSQNNLPICVTKQLKQRQIWSSLVILIPYQLHHVSQYNKWMQDADLQYLTGSEPLTLEEEYRMHHSWINDSNKCTFILLDRVKYDSLSNISDCKEREVQSMIGDVNFYLQDNIEAIAEIEIMIAQITARGRGFGKEAAKIMMKFAHENVGINKFEAKIKYSNSRSLLLFANYFGFVESSRSNIFEEITLESDLNDETNRLKELFSGTNIIHKLL